MNFPKFLLDSGDPDEYKAISKLAKEKGSELWGSTTNPSLIAKKLAGKKISQKQAFDLQKEIVLQIIEIVPGAVSAEVYADDKTTAEEMIAQGNDIATWHKRVVVKLPTNLEGFKARTALRRMGILINNTLVFSQEQVFAICLHEKLLQKEDGPIKNEWPPFISPFVGRLDDIGQDGMAFVENSMKIKELVFEGVPTGTPWMLQASVRSIEHIKRGIDAKVEIMTAPAKTYQEWFNLSESEQNSVDSTSYANTMEKKAYFEPSDELLDIATLADFMDALEVGVIDIRHELTEKGLVKFAADWKAIITS